MLVSYGVIIQRTHFKASLSESIIFPAPGEFLRCPGAPWSPVFSPIMRSGIINNSRSGKVVRFQCGRCECVPPTPRPIQQRRFDPQCAPSSPLLLLDVPRQRHSPRCRPRTSSDGWMDGWLDGWIDEWMGDYFHPDVWTNVGFSWGFHVVQWQWVVVVF